jgi:Protein of unknown function (DUF3223)
MPEKSSTGTGPLRAAKRPTGYHLGMQVFRSKQAVTEAIKTMLAGYAVGAIVRPEDESVILDLLQFHPHAQEKIGVGIKRLRVEVPPGYPGQRCFWIERLDGSRIDFSYRQCLQPASPWVDLTQAMRLAIAPQIVERKTRVFGARTVVQCPVTDVRCTWEQMHVDHRPPLTFARLMQDFLLSEGLGPEQIDLDEAAAGIGSVLANAEWSQEWQDYHALFADLWVISIAAHVELTRTRLRDTIQKEVL